MSFEKDLFDVIEASKPPAEVAFALHDELGEGKAGIVTDANPDALVGSRYLNVATAIMDCLRRSPSEPVIETQLDIDEPGDQEDRLGKFIIRLLNDSVRRPVFPKLPRYESEKIGKLSTCDLAEGYFLDAAVPDQEEPSLYLVDSLGHIVMFKKECAGQPSAINLKPIQINNVRYPAGTLLNLEESEDIVTELVSGFRIATIDPANISGIAPLRFTLFAFSPEDRPRYFAPVEGYELADSDYLDNNASLSSLTMSAPDKRTLIDTYQFLHPRTDDLE